MIKKFSFGKYKCFKDSTSFDEPSLVNLIIGKNNSGKSSFLDIIGGIYSSDLSGKLLPAIEVETDINPNEATMLFKNTSPYDGHEQDRREISNIAQDNPFLFKITRNKSNQFSYDNNQKIITDINHYSNTYRYFYAIDWGIIIKKCVESRKIAFYNVSKISAERDVAPESEEEFYSVRSNGQQLTNAFVHNYLEKSGDKKLLENIKNGINDILSGEDFFYELKVQREKGVYSIALKNEFGDINLEDMGSGLKTIIFVLYTLYSNNSEKSLFMFEELENNLHPEIQRRLFNKIYDFAIEHKTPVYITSHSHVAINCFYGKPETTVYHIYKQDGKSTIEKIDSDLSKSQILDDLGVKASDLFQTNGVIWVEGPSDRIYIKKWLNLVAPELIENIHYTFLYYGGRLLSHFSLEKDNKQAINILIENRHSAIVIDSDKIAESDDINDTKKRIAKEFGSKDMFCWVTKGKEIENYISKGALEKKYAEKHFEQIEQYQLFPDYIAAVEPNFSNEKVKFAQEIEFDNNDLDVLDLKENIVRLAETIKRWNSI